MLIKEIQLGKSVSDVCEALLEDLNYDYNLLEIDELVEVVKYIVATNKPDLRFAVELKPWSCNIIALNGNFNVPVNYWDDQYSEAKDEVHGDCEFLNSVVDKLFDKKRKKPRPKISQKEYARKQCCPYCLSKKDFVELDESTYSNKIEMGCKKCGETWDEKTKKVVVGFSN